VLPELTYLSFDSLAEGVGASQVAAYVERLAARGLDVRLHTYEKQAPPPELVDRLAGAGVAWTPHPFGGHGAGAGARRLVEAMRWLRGAELVHARADLAAGAAALARSPAWVWDVRSLWADQRIALGTLRRGSPQERVLRRLEQAAAQRCSGVITLTEAVLEILAERHGSALLRNAAVVPTCVDLERFPAAALPVGDVTRLLFSGSLNRYYDLPTMVALVEVLRRRRPARMEVLTPGPTGWDAELTAAGIPVRSAEPRSVPQELAAAHAGLCICRFDAGPSLRGAMPTKIAEFLATGRPIVVNRGLGDLDELLPGRRCGVVVERASPAALERAAAELEVLLDDPGTPDRCRALAEAHFDLDRAIDRLLMVYESSLAGRGSGTPRGQVGT
jgi:glycosyltransferase involved in cell wall biosynthesis